MCQMDDEPIASDLVRETSSRAVTALLPADVRPLARLVVVRGGAGDAAVVDAARRDEADLIVADSTSASSLLTTAPCAVLAIPSAQPILHAHR